MSHIELLNQRLGEALGFVNRTKNPRFKWVLSTECFWYHRNHLMENFERRCWADRLGKVWLIAQWGVPKCYDPATRQTRILTESDWWQSFKGQLPFPKNGEYSAHAETQQPPGMEPTDELNQNYIWALGKQMNTDYEEALADGHLEMALDRAAHDARWMEQANEVTPAFGNWNSGNRGGNISFGGIE